MALQKKKRQIFFYTLLDGKESSINRVLFDLTRNDIIVHLNGIPNDFRQENIEILSRKEYAHKYIGSTMHKKSKYNNVSWYEKTKTWKARLIKNDHVIYERYFTDEDDAAIVADVMSIHYYGEVTSLNFPNLSFELLEKEHLRILEKYGESRKEIKSKVQQGSKVKGSVSKYVGVTFDKRRNKWYASIKKDGTRNWCGSHTNEVDAARAYNQKAIELFGKNAVLNCVD
jgi:hypothetical protein